MGQRVFEKVECVVGSSSVSILLKGVVDGFEWVCSWVYGLNDDSLRDLMWAEMWAEFDSESSISVETLMLV